jgi:carboxypeptidase PM20D1
MQQEPCSSTSAPAHLLYGAALQAGSLVYGIVLLQVPSHKAPHFQLLAAALKEVYSSSGQELDVVPSLLSGGTDSKFYAHLSEHGVLRHIPITANRTAGDIHRIHGTDERVAVEDVRRAFCVYQRVVAGAGMLGDDAATV